MNRLILLLISLALGKVAIADVQFVMRDSSGQSSTVSSNGSTSRIDTAGEPGHVLVDHSSGELLMVDPGRRQVFRSTHRSRGVVVGGDTLSVKLEDRGGGPQIAGYATRKYEFNANGEPCGTIYASRKLMGNPAVREMLDAMRAMRNSARGMTGGLSGILPACQRASLQLSEVMDSAGMPMRVLDAGGESISEILSVDTGKSLPASHYQVPEGMQVVDMSQRMKQASEQMQKLPDMNELMQQMQQGGAQMTPEMQQQMRQQMEQLQNMLEQMEQQ